MNVLKLIFKLKETRLGFKKSFIFNYMSDPILTFT